MKVIILLLVLASVTCAKNIPYTIKGGTIIWKPIPNDIDKTK